MIPVADVRLASGIDAQYDPLLGHLIEQATAMLGRELIGYYGPVETFEDTLDVKCCQGRLKVTLHREPIEVTKVETRSTPFAAYEEIAQTTDDLTNWVLSGRDLLSRTGFPAGKGTLRVTYRAGYAPGTAPAELQALVQDMVIRRFRSLNDEQLQSGLQSETLGDYSYTRFSNTDLTILEGWQSVARRWKRMLV